MNAEFWCRLIAGSFWISKPFCVIYYNLERSGIHKFWIWNNAIHSKKRSFTYSSGSWPHDQHLNANSYTVCARWRPNDASADASAISPWAVLSSSRAADGTAAFPKSTKGNRARDESIIFRLIPIWSKPPANGKHGSDAANDMLPSVRLESGTKQSNWTNSASGGSFPAKSNSI